MVSFQAKRRPSGSAEGTRASQGTVPGMTSAFSKGLSGSVDGLSVCLDRSEKRPILLLPKDLSLGRTILAHNFIYISPKIIIKC